MGLKKYDAEAIKAQEQAELEAKKALEAEQSEEETEEVEPEEEVQETGEVAELSEFEKNVNETVKAKREGYKQYIKKQRWMNRLATFIVLLSTAGGMAFVLLQEKLPKGVGIGCGFALIVVGFIATFIISKILKDKRLEQALNYVDVLYQETNKYIFSNTEFTNLNCQPRYQVESELFTDARLYKNIRGTRSRNYATVDYKGHTIQAADLAGNILIKNRTSPMFLGKWYDYASSYDKEDGVILFQLKGKELSRPIDNVDDLKLVDGNKKYNIYSNDENWRKVINDKVLHELTTFRIDSTLIDVLVSIRKGKVSIGIDYSDAFMDVPVESEYNFENTRRAKRDFEKVLKIFDLLNK